MLAAIDYTNVLDTLIATVPAIIAAVGVILIHGQIKTPSGKNLGEVVEYAHDTAIANNMLLRSKNGPTSPISKETVRAETTQAPQAPAEQAQPPVV